MATSGAVGGPPQPTIAMPGFLPGPHCLKARGIVLSCFLRVDTKRPGNRLRNAFMIGSSAKTAARLSRYAIPAGDSALYSTKRTWPAKKLSRRDEGDEKP